MLNRLDFEVVGSLHTYRGGGGDLCGNCNFCMSKINIGGRRGDLWGGGCYGEENQLSSCSPSKATKSLMLRVISKGRPQSTCLKASALFAMPERRSSVVRQHRQAA